MSTDQNHIDQIRRYLNGELDAKTMHKLEREAQDDPFLMDALEGYGMADVNQQANLDDLQQRLADRVAPKKERSIIMWRLLPVAASLLIAISVGYWLLKPQNEQQTALQNRVANIVLPDTAKMQSREKADADGKRDIAPNRYAPQQRQVARVRNTTQQTLASNGLTSQYNYKAPVTFKVDTVEYKASAYHVRPNATTEELLKKMKGIEVDSAGNLTHQGQQVTKARLNGKDYAGGNVQQAIKNLPADVVSKIQIIDDFGDQAARTGIRSADPDKVLNITTDSSKKKSAVNALAGRVGGLSVKQKTLAEVTVASPLQKNEVQAVGTVRISDKNDSTFSRPIADKAKQKIVADSTSALAEVVVTGYADKSDSPAKPVSGWKGYASYIASVAFMPDNSIGKVRLAFKIAKNGTIYAIRILKGQTPAMNQKAIEIVKNGPAWKGGKASNKEIRLKINFHKQG